jgi:PIN domain nuclease of toxin-antitoxin system
MKDITVDSPILLDTHVLIWSLSDFENLSDQVKKIIDIAKNENRLFISSISLWEIAMLKSKKRINIYKPIKEFLKAIVEIDGIRVVDISPDIAADSTMLLDDFHGDPADRIIAATAINNGAILLTRDRAILSWAELGNIKAIEA